MLSRPTQVADQLQHGKFLIKVCLLYFPLLVVIPYLVIAYTQADRDFVVGVAVPIGVSLYAIAIPFGVCHSFRKKYAIEATRQSRFLIRIARGHIWGFAGILICRLLFILFTLRHAGGASLRDMCAVFGETDAKFGSCQINIWPSQHIHIAWHSKPLITHQSPA